MSMTASRISAIRYAPFNPISVFLHHSTGERTAQYQKSISVYIAMYTSLYTGEKALPKGEGSG